MAQEIHIKIDDVIGTFRTEDNRIYIGFMAFMIDGILEANSDVNHITLHCDCPGGDIMEGYRIINKLETFKKNGGTVAFINEGMAASMMTGIAQAATPGMRFAYPASTWMMHKPLFDQLDYVNANDLRSLAFQLDNFEETLVNIYAKASGNTLEQVKAHLEEEAFISAEEAIRRGYLDSLIEPAADFVPKQREAKAVAFYNPPKENNLTFNIETPMAKTKEPTKWDQLVAFFKNLSEEDAPQNESGESAPVAASEPLQGEGAIYFEGELAEGKLVYTDEAMTILAADGEHVLADGRTITVAEGAVTAIAEAAPANNAELEAANLKIAELEAKIEGIQNSIGEKDKTITALKAQARKVTAITPPQNHAGDNSGNVAPELVPFNSAAEKLKAKYNRK